MEDLSHAGGHRTKSRTRHAHGQDHRAEALRDLLLREIDVATVGERHYHLREAIFGKRTDLLKLRQTGDALLDRSGNLALYLLRCQAGGHGVDLHLHGGRIGEDVDVEGRKRDQTDDDQPNSAGKNEQAIAERPVNELSQHGFRAPSPRRLQYDPSATRTSANSFLS